MKRSIEIKVGRNKYLRTMKGCIQMKKVVRINLKINDILVTSQEGDDASPITVVIKEIKREEIAKEGGTTLIETRLSVSKAERQ